MGQMKEQNKTPEKELSKTERANLSDAEFKTLVIQILKELIEYGNNIKEEMNITLSEIKKNLQGTNSGEDEVKNQMIRNTRKEKAFNQNSSKKKRIKNKK